MTDKLDVGKALEKLRGREEPKSRMNLLDAKNKELDEELRELRSARLRLERDNARRPQHQEESNLRSEDRVQSPITRRFVAGLLFVACGAAIVAVLIWLVR